MKKQVTFAETQTVHRLRQHEASSRRTGTNESKMALKDAGANFNRPSAARAEPRVQRVTTIQIPKTMTAAPFLKHAALTPAQREYLYTVAASYSSAHVRGLITQHYMNVLHRCIRAGSDPDGDDLVVTSVNSPENEGGKRQSTSRAKHQGKKNTGATHPGKSFLPKIPNRQTRPSNTSASKHRRMKKRTSPPTLRGNGQRRAGVRLLEEEEEEEGLDDSLSEYLSSLSVVDWDNDAFSDL